MNLAALIYLTLTLIAGIGIFMSLPLPWSRGVKFCLGAPLGIILATQCILLVSLIAGFNLYSVIVALGILILVTLVLIYLRRPKLFAPWTARNVSNKLRRNWPLVFISLTLGLFSVFIFWTKILAPGADGSLMTGTGGLYGDTAMHSAFTMSMATQGLPPQNPLFAGIPLVYPFLVNLFSAALVLLGFNLRFAFILPQIIYFSGVLVLFYLIARAVAGVQGAFYALLIYFLGWGFGFTSYIRDSLASGNWTPIREYTNNLAGFEFHNVLTGLIYPERSFLPGLFIGLLVTLILLEKLNSKQKTLLPIVGVLLGFLPLWHTHSFIFVGTCTMIWITLKEFSIRYPSHTWKHIVKDLALVFIPALVFLVPIMLWFSGQVSQATFLHISPGWITNQGGQLIFWVKNTGLVIPLALLGFVWLPKYYRSFFVPVFLMFFVANIIIFQPWAWDNIKLFAWVFLFFCILAGLTLARIAQLGFLFKIGVAVVLVTLTASGILSLVYHFLNTYTIYDASDLKLAEWVKQNTSVNAVFLIDPAPTHPVPGLTGRSVYLGYPGHLWVHGINYGPRETYVRAVLEGKHTLISSAEIPFNYIVTRPGAQVSISDARLIPRFENQKFVVYAVEPQL